MVGYVAETVTHTRGWTQPTACLLPLCGENSSPGFMDWAVLGLCRGCGALRVSAGHPVARSSPDSASTQVCDFLWEPSSSLLSKIGTRIKDRMSGTWLDT